MWFKQKVYIKRSKIHYTANITWYLLQWLIIESLCCNSIQCLAVTFYRSHRCKQALAFVDTPGNRSPQGMAFLFYLKGNWTKEASWPEKLEGSFTCMLPLVVPSHLHKQEHISALNFVQHSKWRWHTFRQVLNKASADKAEIMAWSWGSFGKLKVSEGYTVGLANNRAEHCMSLLHTSFRLQFKSTTSFLPFFHSINLVLPLWLQHLHCCPNDKERGSDNMPSKVNGLPVA